MTKGINKPTFWMRTSRVVKGSTFHDHGRFRIGGIGKNRSIKSYKVALDKELTPLEASRVKEWFMDDSMSAMELNQIVDAENFAREMVRVDLIAVSSDFKSSGLKNKWIPSRVNVLVLKLEDVLREVRRFEDEKLKSHIIDKSRKTILEGADPEATMLDSYHSNFAGGHLYRLAEYHFFPIRVDSVYRKDDTGFYELLEKRFGRDFGLGIYEVEFAVARTLFDKAFLDKFDIAAMINAVKGKVTTGEDLTAMLIKQAPDYLELLDRKIEARIKKFCSKLYLRYLRFAPPTKFESKEIRETIAMLTWGVRSKYLDQNEVEQYVKGEYSSEIAKKDIEYKLEAFITEVTNHLLTEARDKKGIFSLSKVIDFISNIKVS